MLAHGSVTSYLSVAFRLGVKVIYSDHLFLAWYREGASCIRWMIIKNLDKEDIFIHEYNYEGIRSIGEWIKEIR